MRFRSKHATRSHRPFQTQGASIYVGYGADASSIPFRKLLSQSGKSLNLGGSKVGGDNVLKTARVDFTTDDAIDFDMTGLADGPVWFQIRTCKDDVESEHNYRPARIVIADEAPVDSIRGLLTLLESELLSGGIVRFHLRYVPALDGVQPDSFIARRTAGPTSPADASVSWSAARLFTIDTPELSDGTYTYSIFGSNDGDETELLADIEVIPDATGPSGYTGVTVEVI